VNDKGSSPSEINMGAKGTKMESKTESKQVSYGWFSAKQYHTNQFKQEPREIRAEENGRSVMMNVGDHAGHVYRSVDGSEVLCTGISKSSTDPPGAWDDYACLGEVTDWIRNEAYDRTKDKLAKQYPPSDVEAQDEDPQNEEGASSSDEDSDV